MPRVADAVEAVGGLAAEQWGLVTTAQARAEGLSTQQLTRLAGAGILERLRHGVYRITGAPAGPHDDLAAAWLGFAPAETVSERLADPNVAVVSHRSAALLHQLGDLDAEYLEFTTGTRKQTRDPQIRIYRRQLQPGEWTLAQGLPITTVLTTIKDLATARIDGGHLAGVVRDAVTTHHLGVAEVAEVLSPYAHHYGAPLGQGAVLLQRMLEQAGVPESTHAVGQLVSWSDPSEQVRQVLASAVTMSAQPEMDTAALKRLHEAISLMLARPQSDTSELKQLHKAVQDMQINLTRIQKRLDIAEEHEGA
jgi:putative AbiEi antitoxin of type IV toxin-antitoxin system